MRLVGFSTVAEVVQDEHLIIEFPTDLTDAIERLLKPLCVFHVKVHEIAMMMTIALRFVPTLLEETDKIIVEAEKELTK